MPCVCYIIKKFYLKLFLCVGCSDDVSNLKGLIHEIVDPFMLFEFERTIEKLLGESFTRFHLLLEINEIFSTSSLAEIILDEEGNHSELVLGLLLH